MKSKLKMKQSFISMAIASIATITTTALGLFALSSAAFAETSGKGSSNSTSYSALNSSVSSPLPKADPLKQGFSKEGLKRIDDFIDTEISQHRMPGAVLAVAHHGKLVLYKAYGQRDPNTQAPMTLDAVFHLASMTKVMATVGALSVFEEGKLPLNTPVSNWFDEFKSSQLGVIAADGTISQKPVARAVTVQDLMRHTNGMPYGERGNTPIHKLYPPSSASSAFMYDADGFIKKVSSAPLLYEPGSVWDYGFGIDVLGLTLEKIEGAPLETILAKRVWSKVGMPSTSFHPSTELRAKIARPFNTDPITGKPQSIAILDTPTKFDCGGSCAFSTAGDYLRFAQMLLNKGELDHQRVLSPSTVKFMTSDHLGTNIKNNVAGTEPGRAGYGFGLGVAVRTVRGVAAVNGNVGEFTWNGASGTIFWVDPLADLAVVMMAATPGEIRKIYREKLPAVIYAAMVE